ncbi:hypothetical protein K439DRAFT_1624876 [Ramaria rubella]|nr:hypothetical protein K439DRAFT_1624876 [Ramaria rubella]
MCLRCFALQDFVRAGGDVGCTDIGSPCMAFIRGGARRYRRAPFGHAPPPGCMDGAAHSGAAYAQSQVDGRPVEGPQAWMRSAWGLQVVVVRVGGMDIMAILGGSKNAPV